MEDQKTIKTIGYCSSDDHGIEYGHIIHWTYEGHEDSVYFLDVLFCPEVKTMYIIDICEISDTMMSNCNKPIHINHDIQSFIENDIYCSELVEELKSPLLSMYQSFEHVRFYNNVDFTSNKAQCNNGVMHTMRQGFGSILHESICDLISKCVTPPWCSFMHEGYGPSQHMKWVRSDTSSIYYGVYKIYNQLLDAASKTNSDTVYEFKERHVVISVTCVPKMILNTST